MQDSEERSHATLQVDRLLSRCFPNQPVRELASLRSLAIEKATQALKTCQPTSIDAELGLWLQRTLELLPAGDVRNAAARAFTSKYKAIPANYAAYTAVVNDPSPPPKRSNQRYR